MVKVPKLHIGTINLSPQIKLQQVLCFPTFSYNLLSICKLFGDTKLLTTFTTYDYYFQDPTWTQNIEIGKSHAGLYLWSSKQGQLPIHTSHLSCA